MWKWGLTARAFGVLVVLAEVVQLRGLRPLRRARLQLGDAQRAVAALDHGERADEGVFDASQAQRALGAPSQRAAERSDEDGEHVGAQSAIEGEHAAHRPGQRADPLADGHLGQDLVDQVGGDVGHTPAEARGAKATAFA